MLGVARLRPPTPKERTKLEPPASARFSRTPRRGYSRKSEGGENRRGGRSEVTRYGEKHHVFVAQRERKHVLPRLATIHRYRSAYLMRADRGDTRAAQIRATRLRPPAVTRHANSRARRKQVSQRARAQRAHPRTHLDDPKVILFACFLKSAAARRDPALGVGPSAIVARALRARKARVRAYVGI